MEIRDGAYALGSVFLIWLGVTVFALLTRMAYDLRQGQIDAVDRLVERRANPSPADAAEIQRKLARLPRRLVERIAADTSTGDELAAVFARHAMARNEAGLRTAAALTSEVSRWRRIAALRILARSGSDAALPLLTQALSETDADVVNAALATLGEIRDERAAAALVRALRDGEGSRSRIATQLDEFPLDIEALLLPLLRDADAAVRYWAVMLLSRYPMRASLPLELASLVADEHASVRAAVAETLGAVQGTAAISTLLELLDDEIPFVRAHAARALGAHSRPALAAQVAPLLTDRDWWVRAGAKRGLEELGSAATEHLLPWLDSRDRFARNGAAEVLQNTGVVDELAETLIDDPEDEPSRDVLRSIVEAGGERFERALLARVGASEHRPHTSQHAPHALLDLVR